MLISGQPGPKAPTPPLEYQINLEENRWKRSRIESESIINIISKIRKYHKVKIKNVINEEGYTNF